MRVFETGAIRDTDVGKPDYEAFISPLVTKRYGEYMNRHRVQADGHLRDADNWQLGISETAYMKSLIRHVEDMKLHWDGYADQAVEPDWEDVLCAVLFNVSGLLFESVKARRVDPRRISPYLQGSSSAVPT